MNWLGAFADLATIITAAVAAYGYSDYRLTRLRRRKKVEALLASKTAQNDDSLLVCQIAAALKLTDEQVVEAAYHSPDIEGTEGQTGMQRRLRFNQARKRPSKI